MRTLTFLLVMLCLTQIGVAQSLTTTYFNNNGQSGNMFDIQATNAVTVTALEVNLDAGASGMEVYIVTGGGSFVGFEGTSSAWTLIGSFASVFGNGPGAHTWLPMNFNVAIPAGGTQGFYVTSTSGTSINYTNGVSSGLPAVAGGSPGANADIAILEGTGNVYPFGGFFGSGAVGGTTTRVWNGTVHYTTAGFVPEAQINSAALSMDIDGVMADGLTLAVATKSVSLCTTPPTPATGTLTLQSAVPGFAFEVAINNAPLLPASANPIASLIAGQVINFNIAGGAGFLNGGAAIDIKPYPGALFPGASGGYLQLPFSTAAIGTTSLQAFGFDPASGAVLSQGVQMDIGAAPAVASVPLALADDATFTIDTTGAPGCWTPTGIPFYGTIFTEMHVSSNGNVQFGDGLAPNATCCRTPATFATGLAAIGVWCDLDATDPAAVATTSLTVTALGNPVTAIRVDWVDMPYFAAEVDPVSGLVVLNSFGVEFDLASGIVTLDGLQGVGPDADVAQPDDNIMGISAGTTGLGSNATDPLVNTIFDPLAGVVSPSSLTDMTYEALAVGVGPFYTSLDPAGIATNVITFLPEVAPSPFAGNYSWLAAP